MIPKVWMTWRNRVLDGYSKGAYYDVRTVPGGRVYRNCVASDSQLRHIASGKTFGIFHSIEVTLSDKQPVTCCCCC